MINGTGLSDVKIRDLVPDPRLLDFVIRKARLLVAGLI
jgi:hypothetical protein